MKISNCFFVSLVVYFSHFSIIKVAVSLSKSSLDYPFIFIIFWVLYFQSTVDRHHHEVFRHCIVVFQEYEVYLVGNNLNWTNLMFKVIWKWLSNLKGLFAFYQFISYFIDISYFFRVSYQKTDVFKLKFWFFLYYFLFNRFIWYWLCLYMETFCVMLYKKLRVFRIRLQASDIWMMWTPTLSAWPICFMHDCVQTYLSILRDPWSWKNFLDISLSIKLENLISFVVSFVSNVSVIYFVRLGWEKFDSKTNSHVFFTNFCGVHIVCVD